MENKIKPEIIEPRLVERFMRYTAVCTTSDRHNAGTPSTAGQWELARLLVSELEALGLEAELTDRCYVLSSIPPSAGREALPAVGFLAHLDTSEDVSGENVRARIAVRDGIRVIESSGDTLLGADDKAGIAEIMSAAEYVLEHPEIRHPKIEIVFSPDEETGKGLPEFPMEKISGKYYYTVDGGAAAEIEMECFNAYAASVMFKGRVIHPGEARGKLVNAAAMASYFVTLLPRNESPEATDGYYGYYYVTNIEGNHAGAKVELLLRDFEKDGIERRLEALEAFAGAVDAAFPGGETKIETHESYLNMKKKIDSFPLAAKKLYEAAEETGITLKKKPIRGGTDGARLTELGIPTPNIFTGGRNFHSREEYVSIDDMVLSVRFIVNLIKAWSSS
ncbi:MAG: tripeptide aminopeptidase PepT [Spirochaetaceae bacterium]|jgi:tripeptide aminopeptidase|nr:tripeptide aminopeptidase PepT [Spirochaetaceae bacterium]